MLYPGLLRAFGQLASWSCLFIALPMGSPAAEERAPRPATTSGARADVQELLRSTHHYDPAIRKRHLEQQEAEADVVSLPEVVVNESKTKRQFTRYMDRKRRLEAANRPSLATGGDIDAVPGLSVKPHVDILADDARFKASKPDVYRFTLWSTSR